MYAGVLQFRGSGLGLLKSKPNAKNFIRRLSWSIFSYPKNSTKSPCFEGARSFKVIDVDISKKVVASACYGKQHVCAYLQPFLRANSGRITSFLGGVPLFRLFVRGTPFTQWHEILLRNTRDTKLSYREKKVSISSWLEMVPGRDTRTDGRTNRQNYRS